MIWRDIANEKPRIGQVVLARISIDGPTWPSKVTPAEAAGESGATPEVGFVLARFKLGVMQWPGDASILNVTHWLPIPALNQPEDELDRYSALLQKSDPAMYNRCQLMADTLKLNFPRFGWLVVPSAAAFPGDAFTVRAAIEVNGEHMKAMLDVYWYVIESDQIDWVGVVGKEFAYNIARRILTPED